MCPIFYAFTFLVMFEGLFFFSKLNTFQHKATLGWRVRTSWGSVLLLFDLMTEDGLQTNPMMYLEADNEAGWTDEWATGDQKGKCTSFTSPSHKVYQTVKEITLLN